jgi:hypothetical protein
LVFGILTPTAVLIALLTCTALLESKVRGHAFSWPHHITMFFAACRLELAFLLSACQSSASRSGGLGTLALFPQSFRLFGEKTRA